MRVGFFGTPGFAVPTLQALLDDGHEVACVVAQPDRPAGRGQQLQSPPTVTLARAHGIEVLQPLKVKTGEFPERIEALALDVAVVVAYGRILTPRLLAAPRRGCINVHASLLPRWRGAAPIQWALLAGDATTGVCTMQMDEGLDTGDLLLCEETAIGPTETSGDLHERLSHLGAALLVRTLGELDALRPRRQPEDGITHARMLTKDDGRLDPSRPARLLDAQVRGVTPWPGAFVSFRGEPLKVLRARAVEHPGGQPGTLSLVDGLPHLVCGEGALALLEVQLPGKRPVPGADFARGSRIPEGEPLA